VTEQRRPILRAPGGIDCLRAAFRKIRQLWAGLGLCGSRPRWDRVRV